MMISDFTHYADILVSVPSHALNYLFGITEAAINFLPFGAVALALFDFDNILWMDSYINRLPPEQQGEAALSIALATHMLRLATATLLAMGLLAVTMNPMTQIFTGIVISSFMLISAISMAAEIGEHLSNRYRGVDADKSDVGLSPMSKSGMTKFVIRAVLACQAFSLDSFAYITEKASHYTDGASFKHMLAGTMISMLTIYAWAALKFGLNTIKGIYTEATHHPLIIKSLACGAMGYVGITGLKTAWLAASIGTLGFGAGIIAGLVLFQAFNRLGNDFKRPQDLPSARLLSNHTPG